MKVCYVDESGTAQDPVLVMVGLVADAARLHKTSRELSKFFEQIKNVFPEDLKELKGSRILYGKGGWRNVDPDQRKKIFADLSAWLGERKHDIVLAAIDTAKLKAQSKNGTGAAPPVAGNAWVAAGLNIALQLQAKHQGEPNNKGNTFLFIDDNSQHFPALCDALWSPTAWLDGYYPKSKKQEHLDQIIDTAFAVRSHHCALVQVADLLAFVFRRYFELQNSLSKPEWPEEAAFINQCVVSIIPRLYSNAGAMKTANTCPCATWYRSVAPKGYGVRIHEYTKVQLDIYARENLKPLVKPFMLVVARDTTHANDLQKRIEADNFFGGRYKGRVITVHSNQTGEEKDETVQQLLSVEDPTNPTEIVIHVNMLKEGWDVTNLYTIVPLRTANSRTLVEQSIGRGLRLPYGKRTGVPDVDRLTIVSHDRFQEIVDHANDPNSIIRTGVVIGRDIPDAPTKAVTIEPVFMTQLGLGIAPAAPAPGSPPPPAPTISEPERKTAEVTMQVIRQQFERLARSGDLKTQDVQQRITARVTELMQPIQGELPSVLQPVDVASVVERVTNAIAERTIDIPKIIVTPKGEVTVGYQDFDLDCSSFRQPPAEKDLLIQLLMNNQRYKIVSGDGVVLEKNLEDYIVRGLIDKDDINYDEHSELLYKLAGQMVRHLQSYLQTADDVLNVLQFYQTQLVTLIHAQMNQHYIEKATEYEVTVSKGFQTLTSSMAAMQTDQAILPFRAPVEERLLIRGMLFGGFSKCLYPAQKFDSDTERRFAIMLEDETSVLKWLKPPKDVLKIYYHQEEAYQPDFVVETATKRYLCEPKRASEMSDEVVLRKAKAAVLWCQHASTVSEKPWEYLLIPHDEIAANSTFTTVVQRYKMS